MGVTAVIVAAGSGQRMNKNKPKQFLELLHKPILAWTLEVFETTESVAEIVLVVPRGTLKYCREEIVARYGYKKIVNIVSGGKQRQDSVYKGLKKIDKNCQIIIIHDGVRPFVTHQMIIDSLDMVKRYSACIFAVPVKDTIKRIDRNGLVKGTLLREELGLVQTPQTFEFNLIKKAYQKAFRDNFYGTDDAMLIERIGGQVKVLPGSYDNIKITTPPDLILAEIIQKKRLNSKNKK